MRYSCRGSLTILDRAAGRCNSITQKRPFNAAETTDNSLRYTHNTHEYVVQVERFPAVIKSNCDYDHYESETFALMLKLLFCLTECFDSVFSFIPNFCRRCILFSEQMDLADACDGAAKFMMKAVSSVSLGLKLLKTRKWMNTSRSIQLQKISV